MALAYEADQDAMFYCKFQTFRRVTKFECSMMLATSQGFLPIRFNELIDCEMHA